MTNKMTTKQMRDAINEHYDAIPERQVNPGVYIRSVGSKYVTLLNTHDDITLERVDIDDFYNEMIAK